MKYNAIVDYTVLLTAERDTIQQRLEESDRELSRENARKRGNGGDPPRAKKDEKILPKATVQQVAHFLALHSRSVERCLPYQLFILSSVLNIIVTSACVRVSFVRLIRASCRVPTQWKPSRQTDKQTVSSDSIRDGLSFRPPSSLLDMLPLFSSPLFSYLFSGIFSLQGFSLNVVLFLAVVFFFLGRYLKAT